jgi:hypothetical protein
MSEIVVVAAWMGFLGTEPRKADGSSGIVDDRAATWANSPAGAPSSPLAPVVADLRHPAPRGRPSGNDMSGAAAQCC